jgi:bifunctional non-homologous end joining protein LigD
LAIEQRADPYIPRHVVAYLPRAFPPAGFIQPCQPLLVDHPPAGPDWLHEVKHDGYRIVARKQGERVCQWSRQGTNFTTCQGSPRRCRSLPVEGALIHGEVVAFRRTAVPEF